MANHTYPVTKTEITTLREELRSLPTSTRALLAQDLLESLDHESAKTSVDEVWIVEAERRLDEVLRDRVKTVPGEKVLQRVRNRKR